MEERPTAAGGDSPALVSLAANRGVLGSPAYAATILHLGAQGYLVITPSEAGHLRCALAPAPPSDSGLSPSARMVLSHVRAQLAARGDGPLEALAAACSADVPGCWRPFQEAVRDEAERCGLIRRGRRTAAGRDLAARWARSLAGDAGDAGDTAAGIADPAGDAAAGAMGGALPGPVLSRLAYAVAARVPVPFIVCWPDLQAARRPYFWAWTSLHGEWRAVGIEPLRRHNPEALPAVAIWLLAFGLLAIFPPLAVPHDVPFLYWLAPGSMVAGSVIIIGFCLGARSRADDRQRARDRREAQQAQPPVDGQVIARWVAHGRCADDDSYAPAVAIYDGRRVWSFDVTPGVFAGVRLGDLVGVRIAGRSLTLLDLTSSDQPGDDN
jgi:hypothetical protein